MRVTYIGDPRPKTKKFDPANPSETTYGDMLFKINVPIDIDDASEWTKKHGPRLKRNNHFTVEESAPQAPAAPTETPAG